jgi:hypothetical protein
MSEATNEIVGIVVVLVAVVLSVIASALLLIGISQPMYFLAFLLLMTASILILYVGMIRTSITLSQAKLTLPEEKKEVQPLNPETTYIIAKLEMPNGKVLPISSAQQTFGRKDFEQFLDPTAAMTISRNHFTIYFRNGKFFIEDSMSTNGTLLNGQEIRGTGPHEIRDGDVIAPSGIISVKFRI